MKLLTHSYEGDGLGIEHAGKIIIHIIRRDQILFPSLWQLGKVDNHTEISSKYLRLKGGTSALPFGPAKAAIIGRTSSRA